MGVAHPLPRQLPEALGVHKVSVNELRDFVDRIEVIYAWCNSPVNADLPGRQVLTPLVQSDRWFFGDAAWRKRREVRRYSTAFTAPITYGPSLKTLGCPPSALMRQIGGLKKGEFLAHRNVHRSEDETAFEFGEGTG